MASITAPVLKIKNRLHFHAEVGFGDPVFKILDGLKIYDDPTARNQENEDLPNLVIDVPDFFGQLERHKAHWGECEQVLELSIAKEYGVVGEDGKSLVEWAEKIITALLRDESGNPDSELGGTVPNQIEVSFSDGMASDLSLTVALTVKWRTKAFR